MLVRTFRCIDGCVAAEARVNRMFIQLGIPHSCGVTVRLSFD